MFVATCFDTQYRQYMSKRESLYTMTVKMRPQKV